MQKKMSIFYRTAGFSLVILTLLTLLAACGGTPATSGSTNPTATTNTAASTPTSSNPTQAPTASGNGSSVSVANFSFSPGTLNVSVGTKVTWTNNDSVTHTVTADKGAFNSNNLTPGSTFSFTFTTAGTYSYHCNIHSSMKATIIVK